VVSHIWKCAFSVIPPTLQGYTMNTAGFGNRVTLCHMDDLLRIAISKEGIL
jgi:hypothetical protein